MKISLTLTITFFVLMISGCQSLHFLPDETQQISQTQDYQYPHQPTPGKAMIYVVRPNIYLGLVHFNVYLDSKDDTAEMGYNTGNDYVYFEVEPGRHTIFSESSTWYEKDIEVKAGEILVLEQQQGAFATHQLISLSESAAKFRIMKASPGKIIKTS